MSESVSGVVTWEMRDGHWRAQPRPGIQLRVDIGTDASVGATLLYGDSHIVAEKGFDGVNAIGRAKDWLEARYDAVEEMLGALELDVAISRVTPRDGDLLVVSISERTIEAAGDTLDSYVRAVSGYVTRKARDAGLNVQAIVLESSVSVQALSVAPAYAVYLSPMVTSYLSQSDVNVLVKRTGDGIRDALTKATGLEPLVLVMPEGFSISSIDEASMAVFGWVKKAVDKPS